MRSPNSTSVGKILLFGLQRILPIPEPFSSTLWPSLRCFILSKKIKKTLSSSKMASFSTLLLPSGVSFSKRAWPRNHANKIPSFEVCCFAAEPGVKLASENYGSLTTRRSMFGLIFGISTLGLSVFDANGAGLPPEEKPRLCDNSCEKELENVPMVTTESGLQYKDIQVGQGPTPPVGFQVAANYVAMVQNGQIFDSSLEKGVPYIFRVGSGQVIKGLDEGILSMKIGGKRRLYIPGSLAFPKGLTSAPGRPRVAPNSPVIFDVSLEYIPGLEADDE